MVAGCEYGRQQRVNILYILGSYIENKNITLNKLNKNIIGKLEYNKFEVVFFEVSNDINFEGFRLYSSTFLIDKFKNLLLCMFVKYKI